MRYHLGTWIDGFLVDENICKHPDRSNTMAAAPPSEAAAAGPPAPPQPELTAFQQDAEQKLQQFFDFMDMQLPAALHDDFAAWALAAPLARLKGGELNFRTRLLQLAEAVRDHCWLSEQDLTFWKNGRANLAPYLVADAPGRRVNLVLQKRAAWVHHVFARFFDARPRRHKSAQKLALAWLDTTEADALSSDALSSDALSSDGLSKDALSKNPLSNYALDRARAKMGYRKRQHTWPAELTSQQEEDAAYFFAVGMPLDGCPQDAADRIAARLRKPATVHFTVDVSVRLQPRLLQFHCIVVHVSSPAGVNATLVAGEAGGSDNDNDNSADSDSDRATRKRPRGAGGAAAHAGAPASQIGGAGPVPAPPAEAPAPAPAPGAEAAVPVPDLPLAEAPAVAAPAPAPPAQAGAAAVSAPAAAAGPCVAFPEWQGRWRTCLAAGNKSAGTPVWVISPGKTATFHRLRSIATEGDRRYGTLEDGRRLEVLIDLRAVHIHGIEFSPVRSPAHCLHRAFFIVVRCATSDALDACLWRVDCRSRAGRRSRSSSWRTAKGLHPRRSRQRAPAGGRFA